MLIAPLAGNWLLATAGGTALWVIMGGACALTGAGFWIMRKDMKRKKGDATARAMIPDPLSGGACGRRRPSRSAGGRSRPTMCPARSCSQGPLFRPVIGITPTGPRPDLRIDLRSS
jgi:hypothetical protein